MKKKNNLLTIIVFCIMTIFVSSWSSVSCAAAKQATPKETVIQAYQKILNLKNYHMTIDTTSSIAVQGKNVKTVMNGELDIEESPLLCKSNMNVTIDTELEKVTKTMVQYIGESGDNLIVYSKKNNQWVKQSLAKGSYNPRSEYDDYVKGIKKVIITRDDAKFTVFEVVVRGSSLKEDMKRSIASLGIAKVELADDFLKDLSDVTYYITIDKNTGTITQMEMDLSSLMSKFGNDFTDSMKIPTEKKKAIKDTFSSMKIVTNITFSQFGTVEKISVPQDITF
jgi:hypothetical protein